MLIDSGEEKSAALFFIVPQCSQPAQPEQCVALLIRCNEAYHLLACPYIPLFLSLSVIISESVWLSALPPLSVSLSCHSVTAREWNEWTLLGGLSPLSTDVAPDCQTPVTLTNQTDTLAPTHHPEHHPNPTVCSVWWLLVFPMRSRVALLSGFVLSWTKQPFHRVSCLFAWERPELGFNPNPSLQC